MVNLCHWSASHRSVSLEDVWSSQHAGPSPKAVEASPKASGASPRASPKASGASPKAPAETSGAEAMGALEHLLGQLANASGSRQREDGEAEAATKESPRTPQGASSLADPEAACWGNGQKHSMQKEVSLACMGLPLQASGYHLLESIHCFEVGIVSRSDGWVLGSYGSPYARLKSRPLESSLLVPEAPRTIYKDGSKYSVKIQATYGPLSS